MENGEFSIKIQEKPGKFSFSQEIKIELSTYEMKSLNNEKKQQKKSLTSR